ncbi:RNA 2'-phosphotransferase [Rhizobium leucaenae]|uniref:RNA 2'-phosphotransferase n=1 Tax=Rhizobium leucaenae TaxID=29450 RepID=UPI0007EE8932|nr:RNA 2'-phosphotransferase [Rhizobium leucaenae]MBB6305606.1 putative RNA 2'-phosphotransferase [Rhizobium leucaenae]
MTKPVIEVSKFLSYILRHEPDAIGIELDPEGWANIEELIANSDVPLTRGLLNEVVANSDKRRFSISADGLFIRANQGHSIVVDLGLEPRQPPELLFHGTATRFLDQIITQGLLPQSRQYVHLSDDKATATKVGQRHGTPIILTIPALQMHGLGHQFFQARNGVWLTTEIEPQYLQMSSDDSAIT